MVEECSNRTFQRTLVNISPFRASRAPPPPHHDILSLAPLDPGTIVAVRRTEKLEAPFDLARILLTTETHVSLTYLLVGTTNPTLRTAVFKLVWVEPSDSRTVLKDSRPARNHTPVTGEINTEDLPDLLVATHLTLTSAGRLNAPSYHILHHLSACPALRLLTTGPTDATKNVHSTRQTKVGLSFHFFSFSASLIGPFLVLHPIAPKSSTR
jgi:hypothetical protein